MNPVLLAISVSCRAKSHWLQPLSLSFRVPSFFVSSSHPSAKWYLGAWAPAHVLAASRAGCCPIRATKNPFSPRREEESLRALFSSFLGPQGPGWIWHLVVARSHCNRLPWRHRASPSTT